ncbi:MAG: endonuclease [Asgard group archaeon]|nr:endonuclease [Asgard group archaeon]
MHPMKLFSKLLDYYGPQNWWPGEGFEIAIGAILTQNTSWKNVEIAIENLRRKKLLDPKSISECDLNKLGKLITSSGYFNQKALYLKNLSELWLKNPNPSRDDLLAVKGIGEETADSILLYLLNVPQFVIDSYTIRISIRIGLNNSHKRKYWKEFYENYVERDVSIYNEFHALFVIHAKKFCFKNNPQCNKCFLISDCKYGLNYKI